MNFQDMRIGDEVVYKRWEPALNRHVYTIDTIQRFTSKWFMPECLVIKNGPKTIPGSA